MTRDSDRLPPGRRPEGAPCEASQSGGSEASASPNPNSVFDKPEGEALTRAREIIFASLYHLRHDARAEQYHAEATAFLSSLPTDKTGDGE
jgi:hypothetical protein